MPTINLGKVRFTWRGNYDNANAYEENDVINYNGTTYITTADVAAASPLNPSTDDNFEVFAQGVDDVATTDGDILYYNGTSLTRLPIGEAGEVLKVNASGEPEWTTNTIRPGTRVASLTQQPNSYNYDRGLVSMQDGTLRSWGSGSNYMLGQGQGTNNRTYPGYVAFPPGTAAIQDNKFYQNYNNSSAAIDADGNFWTWGSNSNGECGTGNTTAQYVPFNASASPSNSLFGKTAQEAWTGTSSGAEPSWHVLCTDGTLHAAGDNDVGQLGQGDTTQRTLFGQVPVLSGITKVAVGEQANKHVLALKVDGDTNYVYAWGYNGMGQLGHGNTTQMNIPMQIQYFNTNSIKIVEVYANYYSSWCLADNGDLYSFGDNPDGQLGVGSTTDQYTPTLCQSGVAEVWIGRHSENSVFIKKTNGEIWACGENADQQLSATGTTTDQTTFVRVKYSDGTYLGSECSKFVVGYNQTYMLKDDGTVWAVGYNGSINLGLGDTTNRSYFEQMPIHRRTATDITITGNSSTEGLLILLDDGGLLSVGPGVSNQTADDDGDSNYVPTPVIF